MKIKPNEVQDFSRNDFFILAHFQHYLLTRRNHMAINLYQNG